MKNVNLKFHHIGKPVPLPEIINHPDTRYAAPFDMYTLDIQNDFGLPVQLHAFGAASTLDEKIKTQAHVAFTCSDIAQAIAGEVVIMPLYEPFAGYRCAMILVNEQPIELIETTLSESEIWGDGMFKDSLLYSENKVES
ncbi:hypothetical protein FACS1894193_08220 [Bacilli bacterium]|nr:hypothetical protein FACS1894192_02620 [Bacilli bacterium]GHU42600.1 hypothetical protein FACS1894193_08220 [Bacilli bacterium]